MNYDFGEDIPFSVIILKSNGTPDTNESPELTLFNDNTGVRLLNGVTMPHESFGHYVYNWISGISANSTFTFYVTNAGKAIDSGQIRITGGKQEVLDDIESAKQEILADIEAKKDLIIADALSNKNLIIADALSNKNEVISDASTNKSDILSDSLSNKNEILADASSNTSQISSEITSTKDIINENIDDSDGRVT